MLFKWPGYSTFQRKKLQIRSNFFLNNKKILRTLASCLLYTKSLGSGVQPEVKVQAVHMSCTLNSKGVQQEESFILAVHTRMSCALKSRGEQPEVESYAVRVHMTCTLKSSNL